MFAGPGSGPLLAAAAAWDELAEDLLSSAASFGSVTADLAGGSWLGASAAAMMAVATQYMGWLSTAAAQATAAASQAAATAAAFEAALAAMVQPAVVAANRVLVQVLAATNWLGQNAPAIADIEAAYEQMWAWDVDAMSGYHAGASAAAEQLAPWQRVLRDLGINIGTNSGSSASGHVSSGTTSVTPSAGSASAASGLNLGYGNSGNFNFGWNNVGNANFGIGNIGNFDIGFGLTGDHQVGIGSFNFSSSAWANLFNPGNANMGIGNPGPLSSSLWTPAAATGPANSGLVGAGLDSPGDVSFFNSGRYVTGGLNAANLNSSALNPVGANTGGFGPALANSSLLNAAAPNQAIAATSGFESGNPNIGVGGAAGPSSTLRNPGTNAATGGIPSSGFFNKVARDTGIVSSDTRQQVPSQP